MNVHIPVYSDGASCPFGRGRIHAASLPARNPLPRGIPRGSRCSGLAAQARERSDGQETLPRGTPDGALTSRRPEPRIVWTGGESMRATESNRTIRFPWRRRKVMLDTNVLCPGIRFPKGKNAKVINKSLAEDDLQITSVNYNEVCHAAKKSSIKAERKNKKPRMTYEATVEGLNTIVRRTRKKKVIPLTVPPDAELKKRYRIRDASDRKIIYAADVTGTEILVTEDKDYYAENAEIPDKIRVMHADTYLDEERRGFSLSKLLRRRK